MFENMWATVLMRDDLDHSVQQWRAHRLRPNAQPSDANEEQAETHEEADGVAEAVAVTEAPEPNPDGFLHTCIRLPRGHNVALAHVAIVLLDRTLSQFDAHYDEVFLASEQRANMDPQRHGSIASPTPGLDGSRADPQKHVATARSTACLDGLQAQRATEAEETSTRPRRRRGAFHLDPKVLEAKVSNRYEVFQLPDTIKALFDKPQKEKSLGQLGSHGKYISWTHQMV